VRLDPHDGRFRLTEGRGSDTLSAAHRPVEDNRARLAPTEKPQERPKKNMHDPTHLKLGNLTLDVPFFQASLSGYSDYTMRSFARRFGCPFMLADVMLAKSMAEPRVLRKACFRPGIDEHPVGAQIMGETPAVMAKAARDLVAVGYDVIDLNFACPVPKVLRRGRGGALLAHPNTVIDIVKAVRETVACPLLIKLRIGTDAKLDQQRAGDGLTDRLDDIDDGVGMGQQGAAASASQDLGHRTGEVQVDHIVSDRHQVAGGLGHDGWGLAHDLGAHRMLVDTRPETGLAQDAWLGHALGQHHIGQHKGTAEAAGKRAHRIVTVTA